MNGKIIETKKGFAVETGHVADDGSTFHFVYLILAADALEVGDTVRYLGGNRWSSTRSDVGTAEQCDPELGWTERPAKRNYNKGTKLQKPLYERI